MMKLENAILETLAYSDIFDFPLTVDELHRFLGLSAKKDEIERCASQMGQLRAVDGLYFLADRGEVVQIRRDREAASRKIFARAAFYGRILGMVPFVRMAALTGSLAMLNLSKNPDMDFMLVAKHGRVWTARAFAIVLGRIASLFGDTICPNLIVSENALEWPLHDLYSARELCQMIPMTGQDVYLRLFSANEWVHTFLPNALPKQQITQELSKIWRVAEFPLRGVLGDKFEAWERTRKIERFSKQAGFGAETVFTADVCQGNFHHHRKWTHDVYQERLKKWNTDLVR